MSQPRFLRSETLTRVFLEFVIVFAGVTLGLLADDWRQDRNARQAEIAVLRGFLEDLARDSAQLAQAQSVARRWGRASLFALRADTEATSAGEAATQIGHAQSVTFYRPIASSYASLKASGQLDLIGTAALRREIVAYFDEQQPAMAAMYELASDQFLVLTAALWPYFAARSPRSVRSERTLARKRCCRRDLGGQFASARWRTGGFRRDDSAFPAAQPQARVAIR
jgi:hypothetical protein